MRRVAGEKHAVAIAIVIGQQKILPPFADIEHFISQRHGDGLFELARHIGVAIGYRMQREMLGRILYDQERRPVVRNVIVAPFADWYFLVEVLAIEQRLAKLEEICLAAELDAELLANGAGATVAADEIARPNFLDRAVQPSHRYRYAVVGLSEGHKLMAVAN